MKYVLLIVIMSVNTNGGVAINSSLEFDTVELCTIQAHGILELNSVGALRVSTKCIPQRRGAVS